MGFFRFRDHKSIRHWMRPATIVLFALSIALLIVQGVRFYLEVQQADAEAVAVGEAQAQNIVKSLRGILQKIEKQGAAFAESLESGQINAENLLEHLKKESLVDSYILGFTVAYAPHRYSSAKKLYAPFYDAASDKIVLCEDFYDYSDEKNASDAVWYLKPLNQQKSMWVSGFGPAAGTTYAGFSVPVYKKDTDGKQLLCVVNAAISLEKLSTLINTQHVGRLGAGLMIDQNGSVLAHPSSQLLKSGKTWLEIMKAKKVGNKAIYRLPSLMIEGKTGYYRFHNFRGFNPPQSGWFFYQPVPGTGWSFGVAIFQSELYRNDTGLRRQKILIALNVLVAFGLLAALFVRTDRFHAGRLTFLVIVVTLGSITAIGFVWYLTINRGLHYDNSDQNEIKINDLTGLDQFIAERRKSAKELRQTPPRFIPTRIYVRSIEFEGAHNVKVSGNIWQTYRKGKDDDLKQGFTFPDIAPDAEALSIEETFREVRGSRETVGWKFRATLRQRFAFGQYPFDTQRLNIRLKHVDEAKNVILIPEIESYRYINTSAQPGLYSGFAVPGWIPRGSYFTSQFVNYDVAFGIPGAASDLGNFPELQYTVVLRRAVLTPFISHILPIVIVMFLLYGVVIMSSLNQQKQSASGFNVFGVLGTCGAFFFTIALMHIDLRSKLNLEVVTYLEALYIIAYFMLLAVSLDSLLFIATDAVPFIEYRDNIVAKLLFWPLFLGLVLGITLFTFY